MRGEDVLPGTSKEGAPETPPRAWGRPAERPALKELLRNTPTCVGKTSTAYNGKGQTWKHPHVRGEDRSLSTLSTFSRETPPRAWGRLHTGLFHVGKHGNTPTCVGKTSWRHPPAEIWGKHPHVRGEDPSIVLPSVGFTETPPRAWGRHRLVVVQHGADGNTPTCVGKTLPTMAAMPVT